MKHNTRLASYSYQYNKGIKEKAVIAVFFITFFLESIGIPFIFVTISGVLSLLLLIKSQTRSEWINYINFKRIIIILTILSVCFSAIGSVNPARSLITLGVLLLAGIIVLFLHTPKLKAERYLSSSIVLMGVLLSLYCLIINVLQLKSLFPTHGYQLVFSRFGSHNHLGDFLLLPLFICLYNLKNNQNRLTNSLLLIFFFPFFILSYSRSAYLSFTVVFVLFLINWLWNIKKSIIKKSVLLLTGGALVSLTATFFIATVFEFKRTPIFGSVNKTLTTHFGLKFKHFGANRLEYANTALQSIKEKPLFGVGPGNFVYASEKYSNIPNYRTHSSHNIFLDIWVEYGSIVFIAVLLLAGIKMRDLLKGKNGNAMLLLALFINFQTDYTFKLVPLMVLFLTVMLIKPAED